MGCVNSKPSNQEDIDRCRARKRLIKQAFQYRQSFAIAHSAYLQSLSSVAATLRSFAEGEVAGGEEGAGRGGKGGGLDIAGILKHVVDQFGKASKAGDGLSRLLETDKVVLEYLNAIGSSEGGYCGSAMGGCGHSPARVLSALSWSWSRTPPSAAAAATKEAEENDDEEGDDATSGHAMTVARLYALEKKIYYRVKVLEEDRVEYEKKWALLQQQQSKAGGGNYDAGEAEEAMERTRTMLRKTQASIETGLQEVEASGSVMRRLRDERLYVQLYAFMETLVDMWRTMLVCHLQQKQIVLHTRHFDAVKALSSVDDNDDGTGKCTSEEHQQATMELEKALLAWHDAFGKMITCQREFVTAINGWLRLHLQEERIQQKQLDDNEEEIDSATSAGPLSASKVFHLCEEWQSALDRLPDRVASEAIKGFVAVVHALVAQQKEELRQKKKLDLLSNKLERKLASLQTSERKAAAIAAFLPPPSQHENDDDNISTEDKENDHHHHHQQQRIAFHDDEEDNYSTATTAVIDDDLMSFASSIVSKRKKMSTDSDDPLAQKRGCVEALKWDVQRQREKYRKCIEDTRVLTMNNVQTGLPGVLEAMAGFSAVCAQAMEGVVTATDTRRS